MPAAARTSEWAPSAATTKRAARRSGGRALHWPARSCVATSSCTPSASSRTSRTRAGQRMCNSGCAASCFHSAAPRCRFETTKPSASSPWSAALSRAAPMRPASVTRISRTAPGLRGQVRPHAEGLENAPAAIAERAGAIIKTRLRGRIGCERLDQRDPPAGAAQRERQTCSDQAAADDGDVDFGRHGATHAAAISFSISVRIGRRPGAQHFMTFGGNGDVIFNADADIPEALRDPLGAGRNVDARLHRQHHARFEHAPFVTDLVVTDIVHVDAEPVPGPVHEEFSVRPVLDQAGHRALEQAEAHQPLGDGPHGRIMRLVPVIARAAPWRPPRAVPPAPHGRRRAARR